MSKYQRLTHAERYQIVALLKSGVSIRGIGKVLNRSPGTISREIKRNRSFRGYNAETAQKRAQLRRASVGPPLRIQGEVENYVRDRIQSHWSPEQISGRLKLETGQSISPETIYRFVYKNNLRGDELWRSLRRQHRKRVPHSKSKKGYFIGRRIRRTWIESRPQEVELRCRIGDIEIDTIEGKRGGSVLLTMVDRTTRKTHIRWLERKASNLVHNAILDVFESKSIKTITNDNGAEFSFHDITSRALNVPIYFCRPYQSWQRGTVENTNGLIRQYFPKRKDLKPENVKAVEAILNNRPRKCLGYKTPNEVEKEYDRMLH